MGGCAAVTSATNLFSCGVGTRLRRVAVVGSGVAKDIFDKASPLGKTIKINGQGFQVIGVFKEKGGTGFRNPDDAVYVPVTTAMRRLFGLDSVNSLSVQARTLGLMDRARTEVEDVIRRKHRIASGAARAVAAGQTPKALQNPGRYAVRSGGWVASPDKDLGAVMTERFGHRDGYIGKQYGLGD